LFANPFAGSVDLELIHSCLRGAKAAARDGRFGKPSDQWAISLCRWHHREQHEIGEAAFEQRHDLNLIELATEFARRSPYLRGSESAACR
jgi:hypothetical protein